MRLKLIDDLDDVKRNMLQYNQELKEGRMHLRTNGVQQWFYIEEIDLFGPSRYIGYKDVTIEKHSRSSSLNGGTTTNHLNRHGFILCQDEDLKEQLINHLLDQLSVYDCDIRRNPEGQPNTKINILEDEIETIKNRFLFSTKA